MNKKDFLKLITAIAVSQAAGLVGTIFTLPSIPTWYASLEKPALTPPSWVFGPVWTGLFLLMGIAAFLIWKNSTQNKGVKIALGIFMLQLVLNTLWSFLFFGLQDPWLALIEIACLWAAILVTLVLFYKIKPAAGLLLIPYLLWVSFATYLNYSIWILNA